MIENLHVDKSQTPEKFQYLTADVLNFLAGTMQALDALEKEIYKRHQLLQSERTVPNQIHEDEDSLWEDYFQRCEKIIAPASTKPYKDTRTFGNPAHYDYLNDTATKITLLVKSADRATVEFMFDSGIAKKEQFVLKRDGDRWKIDTKKYGYPGDPTWRKDEV
jgi:hypothetical protein